MSWLPKLTVLAELILEILKVIRKNEAASVVQELKDAKTSDEKRAAAAKISAHLYSK